MAKRLKEPAPNQVGLKKLSKDVRNKMGYMKDGGRFKGLKGKIRKRLLKRLDKLQEKSEKKQAKAHERGVKRGKEVVDTKTTTSASPRTLSPHTRTEPVYKREEAIRSKYISKQSKAIDKAYDKQDKKNKKNSYKPKKARPPRAGRRRTNTGGPVRNLVNRALNRISEGRANRGTAGSKARRRSSGCGKDCQRKIRSGQAGFAKN